MRQVFVAVFLLVLFNFSDLMAGDNIDRTFSSQSYVSVKAFGAKGDGVHDDGIALEKAILYCIKNNKTCFIPKTGKSYNLSKTIRISLEAGQSVHISSDGALIRPSAPFENETAYNLTSFQEHVFLSIGKKIPYLKDEVFNLSKGTSVEISGLNFDGRAFPDIVNASNFNANIYIALQIVAENVKVNRCYFKNIFGYGLRIHNVLNSEITNSQFDNVGGRGATPFAQKVDFDGIGDAIYHALVKENGNIKIDNCIFRGKKTNNRRSRSAITFEYSTKPYDISLSRLDIRGYAKCIHIEETARTRVVIERLKMSDFNFGIANVLNDESIISFKNSIMTVGMNDGNDNGDALAFLNYQSRAKIFVDNSTIDFIGRNRAYQSAVGLVEVRNSTIKGNNTNFFFADGNTGFYNCIFVGFGGSEYSFFSNDGKSVYEINNSVIKSSLNNIKGTAVLLKIKNSKIN